MTHTTRPCSSSSITSLKGFPFKTVLGNFYVSHNHLTSLEGIPENILGLVDLKNNQLRTLKNIHLDLKMAHKIDLTWNPIDSHVLGLLMIENLHGLELSDVPDNSHAKKSWGWAFIIDRFLSTPSSRKRLYDCQEELIKYGYEEYAQL